MSVIVQYSDGVIVIKCRELGLYNKYMFYTKKQAIRKFRDDNGLRYKHLNIVEL